MVKLGDFYRALSYHREGLVVSEPEIWSFEERGSWEDVILFYAINSFGEIEFVGEGVGNLIVTG